MCGLHMQCRAMGEFSVEALGEFSVEAMGEYSVEAMGEFCVEAMGTTPSVVIRQECHLCPRSYVR